MLSHGHFLVQIKCLAWLKTFKSWCAVWVFEVHDENIYLWNIFRERRRYQSYRSNFQTASNHNEQVCLSLVLGDALPSETSIISINLTFLVIFSMHANLMKMVRQTLAKEDNVGFHNRFGRDIARCFTWFFTTFHCSICRWCLRYFKVTFFSSCWGCWGFARYWRLIRGVGRFNNRRWFFFWISIRVFAAWTKRYSPFKDIFSDGVSSHLEFAHCARGSGKAAMALHNLVFDRLKCMILISCISSMLKLGIWLIPCWFPPPAQECQCSGCNSSAVSLPPPAQQ